MSKGHLKYELCFLHKYWTHSNGGLTPEQHNDYILYYVRQDFPYESEVLLRDIQSKIIEQISKGMNPKTRYQQLRSKFTKHVENISSANLYHFTGTLEYLVTALKRQALYPSFLGYEEYLGYKLKQFYLPNNLAHFIDTEETELKLNQQMESCRKSDWAQVPQVVKNSKLPIYSCFTEMPESSIQFHAHHYGFFGLSFNKSTLFGNNLISKYKDLQLQGNPNHSGFYPVSYVDIYGSKALQLLITAFLDEADQKAKGEIAFELLKFKPTKLHYTSHDDIYSVYFEREWRFISNHRPFEFSLDDIESVFVDALEWRAYLEFKQKFPELKYEVAHLSELHDFCTTHKIKIEEIERIDL